MAKNTPYMLISYIKHIFISDIHVSAKSSSARRTETCPG